MNQMQSGENRRFAFLLHCVKDRKQRLAILDGPSTTQSNRVEVILHV